jgi:hypothetical protein
MITKAIQKDLVLELAEARARCLLELAEVSATMPRLFPSFLSLFANVPEGGFCELRVYAVLRSSLPTSNSKQRQR